MLIEPHEQEVATTLDVCQRLGNKSNKIPGTLHLSEISRGPGVWDMLSYSF